MREIVVENGIAYIALTKGYFAKVDEADLSLVKDFSWYTTGEGPRYAATTLRENGARRMVRMHHLILPSKDGLVVDHIDVDGTNNVRENLRYVSQSMNMRNQRIKRSHVGIRYDKRKQSFTAVLHVGEFRTLEEALIAYRSARMAAFPDELFYKSPSDVTASGAP